jgi:hypothetical protein
VREPAPAPLPAIAAPPARPAAPPLTVSTTYQARALLQQLVDQGIYGRDLAEVAGRLVDRALIDLFYEGRVHREPRP